MKQLLQLLTFWFMSLHSPMLWSQVDPFYADITNQQEGKLEFKIYPNPLNQQPLTIESSSGAPKEIRIYNVMGELVYKIKTLENILDVSSLQTGIYLFQLIQNNKTAVQRLVIQ